MTDARTVAIFVGTRADLWPLRPVVEEVRSARGMEAVVLVSRADGRIGDHDLVGLEPMERIGRVVKAATPLALAGGDAEVTRDAASALAAVAPDLLVVLGDRHELLAVALAATLCGVPIAHLHGGEITEGAFDDAVRHAVTKLAHLHCAATEESAARIVSMGEEPWRVHVTGAPALAAVARAKPDPLTDFLGPGFQRPVALATYHPPTLTPDLAAAELEAILAALATVPSVIATAPGPDPGADAVADRLAEWASSRPGAVHVESLGERYAGILRAVDVVVGNSSSGLVEAPTAGIPVVNVGNRQRGRLRSAGVVDAPSPEDVVPALRRALSGDFRSIASGSLNPYGDERSAARVARVIAEAPLEELLCKRFVESTREDLG